MIEIKHLTKIYKLNKKQMAESKTKNPYKTAVDDLCLTAKKEKSTDFRTERRGEDDDTSLYCNIDQTDKRRGLC